MKTLENGTVRWRFGVFEVDARNLELRRNGVTVKIREQPFRILVYLLKHAGELVSREDLRRVLWPADTFVDFEHSLNTAIKKLRDALGDSAEEPLYIETVPKRGYRFVAPVLAADGLSESKSSGNGSAAPSTQKSVEQARGQFASDQGSPHRRGLWLGATSVLLLAVVVAGIVALVRRRNPHGTSQPGVAISRAFQIEPLTSEPGIAEYPAISPEGSAVAYVWTGSENQQPDVYVHVMGAGKQLQITHSNGGRLGMPVWSPDGSEIAFTRCDGKSDGVYEVPALGGRERKLTDVECTDRYRETNPLAWLSDGQTMLMIDRCTKEGAFGVVALSLATGQKHCLVYSTNSPGPESPIQHFAVSPDEKTIAFLAPSAATSSEIFTVSVAGGTPRQITHEGPIPGCSAESDIGCTGIMWTPDGQSIVFGYGQSMAIGVFGLNPDEFASAWAVAVTGGPIYRETSYPAVGSLSKDSRRLVFSAITSSKPQTILRADLSAPGSRKLESKEIVRTQFDETDAQPSPNNSQIAWMSARTGFSEIWTSDATGENPFQLTHLKAYSGTPRWSPNGKQIAFDNFRPDSKEAKQIYIVDSDGRNLQKITAGQLDNVVPSWSRDGKWIYFASLRTGSWQVWKHSLQNGSETQVTEQGGFDAFESFDGNSVYFSKYGQAGIWRIPTSGGTESLVIADRPQVGYWGHWAVTRSGLYFLDAGGKSRYRIQFYDFDTHRITPVLTLGAIPAALQPALGATADGTTIFYTLENFESVLKLAKFSANR